MLTIQTTILLYKLRQLNKTELTTFENNNDILTITFPKNIKTDFSDDTEFPLAYDKIIDDEKIVKVRLDEINFLIENNYITKTNKTIKITHHGYHCFQITFAKFCSFCFRSITVPVVVALLTSIAYNYLLR